MNKLSIVSCDRELLFLLDMIDSHPNTCHMQMDQTATFQAAMKLIDALSLEDQTALMELLQKRIRQQKFVREIQEIRQEVAQGDVQFGSVTDFLAAIDD